MLRRSKVLMWMGVALLILIVVSAAAVFVIPNTERGRMFIVRKIAALTHDRVQLTGIHGRFPAALSLDRLELRDAEGLWLWADHISLRWSPGNLLLRHVTVASLRLSLLHVERSPVHDPDEAPSKSSSSVPDTDVKELTIESLELGAALAGSPASLKVSATGHIRSLDDLAAHLSARRLEGKGEYVLDAQTDSKAINATLRVHEPAQGPLANLINVPNVGAISLLATLKGLRTQELLLISLEAGALRAKVDGKINLPDNAADLNYSVTAPSMIPAKGLQWSQIELQGQLHGPFTKLTADGHLVVRDLEAPGGVQVSLVEAQLNGEQGALRLAAAIDGLQIPGSDPKLLKDSRLTVDASVRLDDAKRPLELTAHHRLFDLDAKADMAEHPNAELNLRVPDLRPFAPVIGTPIRGDAHLSAQVDYTAALTRVAAELNTHLAGGNAAWAGIVRGGLTRAQATLEMTDQKFGLESLKVTAPGLSLTADGSAERAGGQKVTARYDLAFPDLRHVSSTLEGGLKVNGTVSGPREHLSADTRVDTDVSVRGSPRSNLSAHILANGLPGTPQGTIEAEGRLDGAPLQLSAELRPVDHGGFHAIIHRADWKSAHADGDVSFGQAAGARGSGRIGVRDLSDFNRLADLRLAGAVDGRLVLTSRGDRSDAQIELNANHVSANGVTGNARLSANGPTDALEVQLEADSPAIAGSAARLNAAAIANVGAKELQLASFEAGYRDQVLKLLKPARLQFAQGLKVEHLTLGMQEASAEFDGQVSPTLDFRVLVRNIQPALVNAFVPDLLASGIANADATLRGTTSAPLGAVHVQLLNLRAKNVQATGLPPAEIRANADLQGGTAKIDAHLAAGGASQLALTGWAPLNADGDIDLKLAGELDLALINPILEASGRHAAGALAIDSSMTGKTSAPEIAGTLRLSNASIHDYVQGLSLTDIAGELRGDHGVLRIEQLTARAAPGNLSVQGTVGLLQPNMPVDLKITAKNAQPIASNVVTANLDAAIQVSGNAREALDVTGKVHLNHAEVTIPGALPPDVAVLDVERAGVAAQTSSSPPLVANLHLDVDAPNRILIKGRGLDAELGGQLHITGTAESPQVDGGFELQRGFFTLVNSKLTFTSGTVTFNGTGLQKKLDPSLDFTAQTKAAEITAIVRITGVADAPQIELTSTPEMPQDEIFARLLFGQPAAQLTALELVETGVALTSLRGGGNGPSLNPIDRVQKLLGLDRLSVGSDSSSSSSSSADQKSGTSVAAGRYVSSRVYVGVKEGTTGASQVDVDVDLTRNLKLQAQLGNGTATAQGVTPENDPGSSLGLAYQIDY